MTKDLPPLDWNARFETDQYVFGTEPSPFLPQQVHHLPRDSRVLMLADGEGRNSVWLAQQGMRVTAFDFAEKGLEKARALAERRGASVDFRQSDILDWPWDAAPYDAVVGIFFQFLAPKPRAEVFAGIDRALRPGGILMLHGFAPRQVGYGTGGPPAEQNMYTLELLRDAFTDYEVLHEADYDSVIDGIGHNGKVALIDFVARKPG